MWVRIALNVFYNVIIFLSLTAVYWGFEYKRYEFVLAGLFSAVIFIVLKIKLIKQVRDLGKNPVNKTP